METVNLFDMTDAEKRKYYSNAKNFVGLEATLLAKPKKLIQGFAQVKQKSMLKPRNSSTLKRPIFNPPIKSFNKLIKEKDERIIPSFLNRNPRMSESRKKIQRERIMNRIDRTQRRQEYKGLDMASSTTPAAQAMDLNIQQLLSEAETMIRRYRLPKSVGDSLKADIMKNHLPDYALKKSAIEQQQKDKDISDRLRPTMPDVNDDELDEEERDQEEGKTEPDVPPGAASGVGGDLEAAIKPLPESIEIFSKIQESYERADEEKRKAVMAAVKVLLFFTPKQVIAFMDTVEIKKKINKQPTIETKQLAQVYLRKWFVVNFIIEPEQKQKMIEIIKNMNPLIKKEFFEKLQIPFPKRGIKFASYAKI